MATIVPHWMGIPVTYVGWEVLFTTTIIFGVTAAVLWILGWVRSFQLGTIMPNGILGIECFSGLVYNVLWLHVKDKDVLETRKGDKKYYLRSGGIYKPAKSGPNIAIIDAVSDYSINIKFANYIINMKSGNNLPKINFQSIQQAAIWFNRNVYVPKIVPTAGDQWKKEEEERMMMAEGIVVKRLQERSESATITTEHPTGAVETKDTASITKTPIPTEGMDDHTFMATMKEYEARMVQLGAEVLPLNVNGENIDIHNIADWTFSPSPENTLDSQYQKGLRKGLALAQNRLLEMMPYVLIIMAVCIGPTVAYLILTHAT